MIAVRCTTARSTPGGIWTSLEHKAFVHARLPRVRCPEHGVRKSACPGRARGRGSRCCFQALVLSFATAMPVAKLAAITREHDTRIWRVLEHHVHAAREQLEGSQVRRVGMDETSARQGQDYLSIVADLDARRVIFATESRSAETVARFAADVAGHGGDPQQVSDTRSDMSSAFISGIRQHLPNATMTFDRYHLAATLSEAVDAVRRHEVATRPELTHTRWLWLKNWRNLSVTQRGEPHRLMRPSAQLTTARALRWREDFPAFSDQDPSYAPEYLRRWCPGAKRSRLQPIKDILTLVEKHFDGILAWHANHLNNHLSNGLLEGINSLIQAAKARARGYRSKTKMITIVYLTAAKLQLPTLTHPIPTYMILR
jgi:transposase